MDTFTWEEKLVLIREYVQYLRLYSIFILTKVNKYFQPSLPGSSVFVCPHWEAQDMACHIFSKVD